MMSDNQAEFDSTRPANGSGSGDYGGTADDAALMDLASTTPAARRPLEDAEDAPLAEAERELDLTNPNLHFGTGDRETVRAEPERSAGPGAMGEVSEAPARNDPANPRDAEGWQRDGEEAARPGTQAGDPRGVEADGIAGDPTVSSDRVDGPAAAPLRGGLVGAADSVGAGATASAGSHPPDPAPVEGTANAPANPLDDRAEARLEPQQPEPSAMVTASAQSAPDRPSGPDEPRAADAGPEAADAGPEAVAADPPLSADPPAPAAPADEAGATEPAPANPAPANRAPTGLELGNATVAENMAGATVGSLHAVDPDAGDTVGYSVSDDRFEVVDGQLKLKDGVSLDHEAEPTVEVAVTASDGTPGGGVRTLWSEDFADLADGAVEDGGATAWSTDDGAAIADASHGVQDQAYEFGQSAQPGGEGIVSWQSAPIDIAGATDLTIGFDLTGRGTLDGGGRLHDHIRVFVDVDGSRHELLADSGRIDGGPEFSFSGIPEGESLSIAVETQATGLDEVYRLDNIRVEGAAEPEGLSTTKTFAIAVENVNEAPIDLALGGGVLAGNEDGATVGRITVTDPDAGDSHSFAVEDDAPTPPATTGYEVEFLSAEAGYRNTLGWYDARTGEGDLLFENMKALDGGTVESFETTATDPADIGFFLIPNGYPKIRGMLGDDPDITVDADAGKVVLQGGGETKALTAWFTDESLNSDGKDHVLFDGDGGAGAETAGTYRWEDLRNLGDEDFQDAIIAVRTTPGEPAATVDDPRFEVVEGQLKLKDGISIDPQAEPTVTVEVTATDRGGLSHKESFSLTVGDTDAPQPAATAGAARQETAEAGGGADLILIEGIEGGDAPGDWTAEPAPDTANGEGLGYVDLADSASSHVVMTEGNDLGLDGLERVEW